jgi:hypothetical protein
MNVLRILQSVEELIYQLALWVLLVPRTLWQVLRKPWWAPSYVAAELAKDSSARFAQYMSPVLFWVVLGIVPHLMVIDLLASIPESRVATEAGWASFYKNSWENRLLTVALFALAGPLAFALRIQRARRASTDRDALRPVFYAQCYCFGPAYFLLLPVVANTLLFKSIPSGTPTVLDALSWAAFAAWILFAESAIIASELGVKRRLGVVLTLRFMFTVWWLTFVLELVGITALEGLRVWK